MEFVLIFIAVILLIIARVLFDSWFSPFGIYGLVWVGTLILLHIPIINYYPLTIETLTVIWTSFYCFAMGSLTVGIGSSIRRRKNNSVGFRNNNKIRMMRNEKWIRVAVSFFSAISLLGLLGIILFLVRSFGFMGLFTYQAALYRRVTLTSVPGEFSTKGVSYYLAFIYSAATLSGYYMAMGFGPFIGLYLLFLDIILFEIIYMGRAEILTFFFLFLSAYYLSLKYSRIVTYFNKDLKRNKTYVTFLFGFLAVISIFIIVSFLLGKGSSEELLYYSSIQLPALLYDIYVYPTGSVCAFNSWLSNRGLNQLLLGQVTFYPIAIILHKIGILKQLANTSYVLENAYTPIPVNTFTYLRPLYEDFGILGIIVIPYMVGLICSYIYASLNNKLVLTKIIVLSYFYAAIIFSIQGNLFWNFYYMFSLFLTYLVIKGLKWIFFLLYNSNNLNYNKDSKKL